MNLWLEQPHAHTEVEFSQPHHSWFSKLWPAAATATHHFSALSHDVPSLVELQEAIQSMTNY
jgi:hypothetical protein